MRHSWSLAVAGLAIAATVSACSGNPGTNAQGTTEQSAPAPTTSSKAPVNRPKQVKLDGIAPCSLLTATQQQQFKPHAARPGTDEAFQSPQCNFLSTGASFQVTTVTNQGAEGWTNGTYKGDTKQAPPIAGFPAVSSTVANDPGACDVAVDTADGQFLLGTARILPGFEKNFPEKCTAARQVAEAAMTTLLASH